MNRKQRRRIAKRMPRGTHKDAERELKRRGDDNWSEECTFDHHKKCVTAGCGCPHHSMKIKDGKGRVVKDVEQRESGLYVARPGLRIPGPRP